MTSGEQTQDTDAGVPRMVLRRLSAWGTAFGAAVAACTTVPWVSYYRQPKLAGDALPPAKRIDDWNLWALAEADIDGASFTGATAAVMLALAVLAVLTVTAIAKARRPLCIWAGMVAVATLGAEMLVLQVVADETSELQLLREIGYRTEYGLMLVLAATTALAVTMFVSAAALPGSPKPRRFSLGAVLGRRGRS